MVISLPSTRGLLSHTLETLRHVNGKRVTLTQGVYAALSEFWCLAEDLENFPTHLYKVVTLLTTVNGYHDAYGTLCEGALLPGPTAVPREMKAHNITPLPSPDPSAPQPIIWRTHFPPDVVANLVSWSNPADGITNSDLEMDNSVLHHNGVEHDFYVRECTVLYRTDNMATMWRKRKGSSTFTSTPTRLLRTQALHQRF